MPRIVVTQDFDDDMDALDGTQPDLVDAAEVLLESLYENRDLLERLHQPTTYPLHTPAFEVKRFAMAQKTGYNIFILKFQDLDGFATNHRILIGYHAQRDTYYVLAITDRDYSYDHHHDAYGNLLHRYEKCGIPKYA